MAKRQREQAESSPKKAVENATQEESPKKIKVDDNVVPAEEAHAGGFYNKEEDAWEWDVEPTIKLRVSKFKGQPRVDIRHLMNGHYTKKGVSLNVKTFEAIRSWAKYEDALQAISAKKL
eukprot:Gregarina_sp_Pseudo_9__2576@NODE_2841_length_854_cov_40_747239_g2601_i0_p2_GENE_NODE_2841_length_854_cov_40_747239_g2601_i0NODE_2841_length_854_cov_40_747239_g2601_i0_p2_ORF_typecomplete_len119_score19_48PC4/PF02229_16/1_5e07_NODE_2841_length_854_cov_40_747239_g2601_i0296652